MVEVMIIMHRVSGAVVPADDDADDDADDAGCSHTMTLIISQMSVHGVHGDIYDS